MAFWYVDINVLYVVGVQDTKEGIETVIGKLISYCWNLNHFCDLGDINASFQALGLYKDVAICQGQEFSISLNT